MCESNNVMLSNNKENSKFSAFHTKFNVEIYKTATQVAGPLDRSKDKNFSSGMKHAIFFVL